MKFFLFSVPVFAVVVALTGCGRDSKVSQPADLPKLTVRVATVEQISTKRTQPVAGTVRPQARAVVAAKVMGNVTQADFGAGQRVKAGEVLVRLSAAEIGARVEQARAAVGQAQRDHERESALLAKNVSTPEAVRATRERLVILEAGLNEAQAMLGYTEAAAPFDGVITRRLVNVGDLAVPGAPLFEIEGLDRLRAEVQVAEVLPTVPLGSELPVQLDGAEVSGVLAELSPAADSLSRTRLAKIDIPADAPVRSGQFVRVLWPAGEASGLMVPANAVTMFGQMERAFVVANGVARLRLIKTGAHHGERVLVLSGLDAGERVIVSAPATLRDGQPVEVQP